MKKIMIFALLSAMVMTPMMLKANTTSGQVTTTKTVVVDRSVLRQDTKNLKRSGKPAPRMSRAKSIKAKV